MPVQRPGVNDPRSGNNYGSLVNNRYTNPVFDPASLQNLVTRLRAAMSTGNTNLPPNQISGGQGDQFRQGANGRTGQGMQDVQNNPGAYAPRPQNPMFQSQSARALIPGYGNPFAGALFSAPVGTPTLAPPTAFNPVNQLAIQWLAQLAKARQQSGPVATRWGFMNPQY
jgi:hypothetical protein